MAKKITSLAVSLSISIITIIVVLLIGEFWVRNFVLVNKTTGECMQLDSVVKFKAIPGSECFSQTPEWKITNKHNSFGLRSPETSLEKPPDTYRILFLGDSFVQGYGVDEDKAFVRLVEKKLRANFGSSPKIEIINTGVPNYSPLIEYLYLKNEGIKFDPDLVILEFDLTDFSNDLVYARDTIYDARGEPLALPATPSAQVQTNPMAATEAATPAEAPVPQEMGKKQLLPFLSGDIKRFFHDHSVLYKWLSTQLKIALGQPLADKELETVESYYTIVKDDKRHDDLLWQQPKKNLQLINDFLKSRQITFIVSAHPHGILVSGEEWSTGRLLHGLERNKTYSDRYFGELGTFLESQRIPFINLLPYFRADKKAKYFPFDGHFNVHGHEVAADGIYQELVRRDLVKKN